MPFQILKSCRGRLKSPSLYPTTKATFDTTISNTLPFIEKFAGALKATPSSGGVGGLHPVPRRGPVPCHFLYDRPTLFQSYAPIAQRLVADSANYRTSNRSFR